MKKIFILLALCAVFVSCKKEKITPNKHCSCVSNVMSICVESPNGGEKYKMGDVITVNYSWCNIPVPFTVDMGLLDYSDQGKYFISDPTVHNQTSGSSSFRFAITSQFLESNPPHGSVYKITVFHAGSSTIPYSSIWGLSEQYFSITQ